MYPYKIIKYLKIFTFFLIFTAVFLSFIGLSSNLFGEDTSQNFVEINEFYICKIDGIIDPTLSNYISKCLSEAQKKQAALLIIIDTPGGLESSMREIALNIINTPIPVVVYVCPEGARAASAGVFIVYASDIAAMSPSTSIGAAHPVNLGSDQGVTEEQMDKIVNDSVSFAKNLASLNDRNGQWAEKAIRESVSITSEEAIEINVINYIASGLDELIKKIDGTTIEKQNLTFKISTKEYLTKTIEMSFIAKFLHIITNPNIAYVLFILGLFGIIYEFSQPGLGVSGAIGVICIILGLYAFSVLPTNYAGLALIVVSIVLFILDLKLNLGGILSLAGIASLIIGSFMLIDTAAPFLQIAKSLIIGLSILVSALLIIVIRAVYKVHRKKPVTGSIGMVGTIGIVIENLNPEGLIKTHGEIWKALSLDNKTIKKGSVVKIISVECLLIHVMQIENTDQE